VQRALENERRFTANAAHELRTPLAALKTQAQVKQLDDKDGEHAVFLNQIISGVDRATHLLEQLLTLARADSLNRDAILQQQVDLRAVVMDVLAMIGGRALEKNIDLSLDSPEEPVTIRGDDATLGILVRNLVDNAIRYTPADGEVRVQVLQSAAGASIVVDDTGPGIPEAE
jgi:two-component system sensor histidine kinase QseC